MEQISRAAHGHVGAAAMLVETGELVSFQGDQRFPMQSVYKFPIGMAVLNKADSGAINLNQEVRIERSDLVPADLRSPIRDEHPRGGVDLTVRELMRFMVSESDGTASDVLLRLAGGPEAVTSYIRGLGVNGIVVATSEREMARDQRVQYRNWATPEAMVALLRAFQQGRGLSASSRAFLLELMTSTPTGPHRLKGLLPEGTVVAHKTGTSSVVNGFTAATNDVGLIELPNGKHAAVAVFVSDSRADEGAREGVLAIIARAVWDRWSN